MNLGLGIDLSLPRSGEGGGPPPPETFSILAENGDVITAENGDAIRTEQ